jgi:membrane-associated protease RseP (regulator of RpoE activity)
MITETKTITIHELGHALAGRFFGLSPEIDLHGMGGTTSWSAGRRLTPGPHILISLAGPFAGIAVGMLILLATRSVKLAPLHSAIVDQIVWVNVGWGVLNLIPMLPLDGGNVMARVFDIFTKGRGAKPAHVVSAVIAGTVILWLLARGGLTGLLRGNFGVLWPMLLATMFLVQNVRALMPPRDHPPESL